MEILAAMFRHFPMKFGNHKPAQPETVVEVSQVKRAAAALPEITCLEAVRQRLTHLSPFMPIVEACSRQQDALIEDASNHGFMMAAHHAFLDHRPLVLSPDMLWLLIVQGMAAHLQAQAKPHAGEGALKLKIRRDEFVKGSPDNPWQNVLDELSAQQRSSMGLAQHDLVAPAFSTTGTLERVAAEVAMQETLQPHYEPYLPTLCGIPEIVMQGTPSDWALLLARTRNLKNLGLEWWTESLAAVLEQLLETAQGRGQRGFWQSFYKINEQSGGAHVDGWINVFFPYLEDESTGRYIRRNPWLALTGKNLERFTRQLREYMRDPWDGGVTARSFPSGLAQVGFEWINGSQTHTMKFIAGFMGVRQGRNSLRLKPEIGWAIEEVYPHHIAKAMML